MTDQELDTLMRRVLLDSLKLDAESTASGELAFEPTPRYQRQMAAMVKDPLKWERRRARPLWKNVAQKIAVILLVFSLSLGSLMAVSPTVRAAVVRWVTEWYETHVVYRHLGAPMTGEIPQYTITDLPDGYVEDSEQNISEDDFVCKVYYNEESDNTVQLQDWDGRYSRRNKEWAKTIPNDNPETVRCGYALNSHPAVLDGFIDLVRVEQQRSRTQGEKIQPSRPSVRDKLKQELPAHKPAAPKKREPER